MSLFKTTDELKNFISIDVNMHFRKISPKIDIAEQDFIKPLLGTEFYKQISAAYAAVTEEAPLSDELKVVLPYIQRALANYSAFLYLGESGVAIGDLGIQQSFGQNSQPAPAWKVNDARMSFLTAGDKAADLLLEFLELAAVIPDAAQTPPDWTNELNFDEDDKCLHPNTDENLRHFISKVDDNLGNEPPTDPEVTEDDNWKLYDPESYRLYKKWYDDPTANTKLSGCIVYKTSIANKYIDILDSRRLFLRLKKRIREIEAGHIKRLICSDQYDEIVTQLKENDLSEENRKLCDYLEPVIAKKALYSVFNTLPIVISADGLYLVSLMAATQAVLQKTPAGKEERAAYMLQLKEDEDSGYENDERELQKFLDENIDTYPLIKDSTCWNGTTTEVEQKWKIDNDPDNKSFSV